MGHSRLTCRLLSLVWAVVAFYELGACIAGFGPAAQALGRPVQPSHFIVAILQYLPVGVVFVSAMALLGAVPVSIFCWSVGSSAGDAQRARAVKLRWWLVAAHTPLLALILMGPSPALFALIGLVGKLPYLPVMALVVLVILPMTFLWLGSLARSSKIVF
jgi:hypothetical protein